MAWDICMPSGRLELKLDGEWESVCIADGLTKQDIDRVAEDWSKSHKVTAARYTWNRKTIEYDY